MYVSGNNYILATYAPKNHTFFKMYILIMYILYVYKCIYIYFNNVLRCSFETDKLGPCKFSSVVEGIHKCWSIPQLNN